MKAQKNFNTEEKKRGRCRECKHRNDSKTTSKCDENFFALLIESRKRLQCAQFALKRMNDKLKNNS